MKILKWKISDLNCGPNIIFIEASKNKRVKNGRVSVNNIDNTKVFRENIYLQNHNPCTESIDFSFQTFAKTY